MTPRSNPATAFSVALLSEFLALGIRDVVLSPGSRSQALALAAAQFESAGRLRLRVRIDERVAGFLALGIAVESRVPVLVITTSGTAVANLHPAVLEAHHSGVPLILLTADRPEELHGIGSNQTTQQVGLFGAAVPFVREVEAPSESGFDADYPGELAHEAWAAATGRSSSPGPVQLNLAFREPLSGPVRLPPDDAAVRPGRMPEVQEAPLALGAAPHTVVIAGHQSGDIAESTARALGAPLLAEVSSGSHFGPNLVVAYRQLLGEAEFGGQVERAIVFGHPTLSREVPALLRRMSVETVTVRGRGAEVYNPGHRTGVFADAVEVTGPADPDRAWVGRWVATSRMLLEDGARSALALARTDDWETMAKFAKSQLEVFREPVTRRMLVEAVWRASWPHDRLVFGASRLIREADRVVVGKKIPVHANRGLSGIDGTVSTALGIALASQAELGASAGGMTRVLLGDLTLLHDVGALLFGIGEPRPRIQVLVGNDGGGTIFDGLEVASSANPEAMDRVLYTPQSASLRDLATAYGWDYLLAGNRGQLDEALTASGTTLVEVPLPRS
ncbi:2-succinyl-5-enolpyruvyl-6-hydroxy-3-cyclohexene-1-carboxylic-acid synthase [Parafrigoribacterium mesophilum]|uniref:2-succinyl-5-enolpyruvyl-6-hydroxy-3- cyclohexene-1-carboxylic-acid synthase n=1 Tax=Parafrigoribacterium mesophilum TaxID=433646 RepID=UPI0031FCCDB0